MPSPPPLTSSTKKESKMRANRWENIERQIMPVTESGCWLWMGPEYPLGYGRAYFGNRTVRAHRLVYEHFIGPIPKGLHSDHLCRVSCCVNPAHIEIVDARTNVLRGVGPSAQRAKQTHCKNGHELTIVQIRNGHPSRGCKICISVKHRARYRETKNWTIMPIRQQGAR